MSEPSNTELERRLAEAESRIQHLERSVRFRLGSSLLEAFKNPLTAGRLIPDLWHMFNEGARTYQWVRLQESVECGVPNDPLRGRPLSDELTRKKLRQFQRMARGDAVVPKANSHLPSWVLERLIELKKLSEEGLPPLPDMPSVRYDISSQQPREPDTPVRVAAVLHTGLPMTSNGYAIRSDRLMGEISSEKYDVDLILRRTSSASEAEGYTILPELEVKGGEVSDYIEAYAKKLTEHFIRTRPQIIHAASNYVSGLAAGIAAKRCGLPFVYEVRGLWEVTRMSVDPGFDQTLGFAVQRKLETQAAGLADRVIAISTGLRDELARRGIARSAIEIARNGCMPQPAMDPSERKALRTSFGLDEHDIVFGFVGSVTPYEGLDRVLDVFGEHRQGALKSAKFLVVGDGPYTEILQQLIARKSLQQKIILTGRLPPDQARAAYGAIDIALYPRPESAVSRLVPPLKPLEAMASGVPTIVSDVPAIKDLVGSGEHVAFVDLGNKEELGDVMLSLASDAGRRTRLGRSGREWVTANRTWEHAARSVTDTYKMVL